MTKKKTARSSATAPADVDFESAMKELEGLVERMEKGELTLEESLRMYERGVVLFRTCQQALKDAEQKVQKLSQIDGQPALTPLEDED